MASQVVVITDGEPTGEPRSMVASVIKTTKAMCKKSHYGEHAIAFQFAQARVYRGNQIFMRQRLSRSCMLSSPITIC